MPNNRSITYFEITVHVSWLKEINICRKEFNVNATMG